MMMMLGAGSRSFVRASQRRLHGGGVVIALDSRLQVRNEEIGRYYSRSSLRKKSDSSSFSEYEYPFATEAPIITRTTAKDTESTQSKERSNESAPMKHKERLDEGNIDRFDDANELSDLEVASRRQLQKEYISTSLQGSQKISLEIPPSIPSNVASSSLLVPTTHITRLPNGVRVVSQETYGQVCSIGVLADFGSRHETQTGTAHLLELLAFQSTQQYEDSLRVQQSLQDWGATSFANSGREQTLWCLDILRPNVEKGMDLLKQIVLEPQLRPGEIELCLQTMRFQAMEMMPEMKLGEVLQTAAYGEDQQLGKPHFCPMDAISSLTRDSIVSFLETNLWNNPNGIVIAGAGIGHDELVSLASDHFSHLQQASSSDSTPTHLMDSSPSSYRGGEGRFEMPTTEGFTSVALALELGGWHSDDLVPACVLQTLLGGGNSFSAGGPGKGMYSRLYRQVLNRYYWAESAEAFTALHNESGLLGISGSSRPEQSREVVKVLTEQLLRLAIEPVSEEELDRARNMLKCNVLTQLESRLVLFEDMGRQVLTYGKREDNAAMCDKIDAVTKEDLQRLVQEALTKPPTLAAVGDNLSYVPAYQEVEGWANLRF